MLFDDRPREHHTEAATSIEQCSVRLPERTKDMRGHPSPRIQDLPENVPLPRVLHVEHDRMASTGCLDRIFAKLVQRSRERGDVDRDALAAAIDDEFDVSRGRSLLQAGAYPVSDLQRVARDACKRGARELSQ